VLPTFLRQAFTLENAVSNGIWTIVYALVYAAISALVPVILHATTSLNGVWLGLAGFALFCTLCAATLAAWAHGSKSAAALADETMQRPTTRPKVYRHREALEPETRDPCGDSGERLRELAKSAERLEHHLTHFDNWRPAVTNQDFDGWVDGRHTTHAAAMQTLLYGFARFFSAAWTYEEQCDTHGDWNEVMEWVRDVYKAFSADPGGLDDYPLMSEPLHELGERSTPGFGKAEARPIELVEFRNQMADDPRFAEYFEPLRTLLQKASPDGSDTPARARLRAVEKSVTRVKDGLNEKGDQP
jgi:hypothetical protein